MRKFWIFCKLSWQAIAEYRADAVIWALSGLITPLVSMAIWLSVSSGNNLSFSKNELITYFLLAYLVGMLTSAWGAHFIIQSIRSGSFNVYLIKPFSMLQDFGSNNISEKILKLVIALVSITALWYVFLPGGASGLRISLAGIVLFVVSVALAGFIAFMLDIIIGLLTFWVYNAYFIREVYFTFRMFFAGAIIPVYFLPGYLLAASIYLPFRYTLSFPIEILMGKVTGYDLLFGLTMQITWSVAVYTTYKFIYRYGVKSYQGYGA